MADDGQPVIEVTLAAGVDNVWAHLRDPVLIRRWFGWEYEGLVEEIEGIFLRQARVDEEAHTLEWEYGSEHGDRFELRSDGDETVLRLFRSVPADGAGSDSAYDGIAQGWISFVQQLRFALARHSGQDRGTLYLSSPAGSRGTLPIAGTLGVEAAAEAPVGGRYEAVAGPDVSMSGEVWFRSEHQLGLTVDQLGDGLLLVTEKPAEAKPPDGAASLTLSAYGPHTDSLQEASAVWEAWWKEKVSRAAA